MNIQHFQAQLSCSVQNSSASVDLMVACEPQHYRKACNYSSRIMWLILCEWLGSCRTRRAGLPNELERVATVEAGVADISKATLAPILDLNFERAAALFTMMVTLFRFASWW
jgi:hypothetical protein